MTHPLIKNISSSNHVTTEIRPFNFAEAFPQLAAKIAENKAPLSELAADYNKAAATLGHGGVNRFADRAAANKRVTAIYTKLAGDSEAHKRWAAKELIGQQRAEDEKTFDATELNPLQKLAASRPSALAKASGDAIKAADKTPTPPVAGKRKAAAPKASKPATQPVATAWDKEAEMPRLRRGAKPLTIQPQSKVYPCRAGTKQALLVDLLARPEGATFSELYDACIEAGMPWRGTSIRAGIAWDIAHVKGYGISSEMLNGEEFARQNRSYEAARLGAWLLAPNQDACELQEYYDPEIRLAVYRLTYPKGVTAPVPHAAVAAKKEG